MNRKLKFALAALLGFSAACSSVKRAPQQEGGPADPDPATATEPATEYRVVAMYGVRSPKADSARLRRLERARPDSLPPVAERPLGEDVPATR